MEKVKMTQDELYDYITAHDVKMSRIAELMGKSLALVNSSFRHHKNNYGRERNFNVENINLLNKALVCMAKEMRDCVMTFGSPYVRTNKWGRTYDPALVEGMNAIGRYMNLTALTQRVLGWNLGKKKHVLADSSSKVYGNISKEDMVAINAEILAVSGVLGNIEIVPDNYAFTQERKEILEKKGRNGAPEYKKDRACEKRSEDAGLQPWEDTSLPLDERYRRFHEVFAEGIIFFRVNSGYTVAQDDSALVCSFDAALQPYTDAASGITTTYIDADTFDIILPRCVSEELRVAITDMYNK